MVAFTPKDTPIPTEREKAFLEAIEIAEGYSRLDTRNEFTWGYVTACQEICQALRTAMSLPLDPAPIDFEPDEGVEG